MADVGALFAQWRDGDAMAFGELVRRYYRLVRDVARGRQIPEQDVDDVVQATFEALLRLADKIQDERHFVVSLVTIATHRAIDYNRSLSPKSKQPSSATERETPEDPEMNLIRREATEHLLRALNALPWNQRALLESYYWDELGYDGLAARFDISRNTVKGRLRRATEDLRDQLGHPALMEWFDISRISIKDQVWHAADTPHDRIAVIVSDIRNSREEVVSRIRSQLGDHPWTAIAEAVHDTMMGRDANELTLPTLVSLAESRGFTWENVHVVVEILAQGLNSFLERRFLAVHDGPSRVVSADEVSTRLRGGVASEHSRATWRQWAHGVKVTWRLRS